MGKRRCFFVMVFVVSLLAILRLADWAKAESAVDNEHAVLCLHFDERDAKPKDVSGKANEVINNGATYYIDGKMGGALRFDGKNDVVEVKSFPFPDSAGSIEAWVWFPAEPQEEHGTIFRIDSPDPNRTYHIIQRNRNSSQIMYWAHVPEGGGQIPSSQLEEGWHHIVATFDVSRSEAELYVDGFFIGRTDYSKQTACKGANLVIGAFGSSRFKGIIDEVVVYDRALSPREVKSRYSEPSGPTKQSYAEEKDLIACWNFDEGMGLVSYDKSGNNNDSKIYGAKYVKRRDGYALEFDGRDDYINCGNNKSLNFGTGDFSIEMWIKCPEEGVRKSTKILSRYHNEDNRWYCCLGNNFEFNFYDVFEGQGWGVRGNTNLADGYWHHIAVVVQKGEKSCVYVDAVVDGSGEAKLESWDNAGILHIGNRCFGKGDYYFEGTLDEVTIYKKALTEEEIKNHYEGGWSDTIL